MSEPIPDGDAIIQRIQDRRGHVWPLHHLMAELDPGFLDIFDDAYCHTMGIDPAPGEDSLPVRYRELICACACAMMPVPIEVTTHHLERAFDHGLTEKEAAEGFHALLIPAGGIAVSNGARALLHLRGQARNPSSTSTS
ncbi:MULTISPECIES: carboxymuconolactone decarboxylase family protein [unclassified Nocardioides]|uniref:carboxymuconolactone decarboxylase family protein n=1 Tax=unclassified Nocardioides TaxID=2615069 RepID=UPI000A69076A|nr:MULTISPECIES: carboxymuconolactone decarboxylase family protein [unclassified Nocardioides]